MPALAACYHRTSVWNSYLTSAEWLYLNLRSQCSRIILFLIPPKLNRWFLKAALCHVHVHINVAYFLILIITDEHVQRDFKHAFRAVFQIVFLRFAPSLLILLTAGPKHQISQNELFWCCFIPNQCHSKNYLLWLGIISTIYFYQDIRLHIVLDFGNCYIVIQCCIFLALKAAIQQSDVIFTTLFWYSVTHDVVMSTLLMIIHLSEIVLYPVLIVIPTMLLQYQ